MSKKKVKKKVEQDQVIDSAQIKRLLAEEADKKREAGLEKTQKKEVEKRISFDVWYAMRVKQIPSAHRKEVIKADMRARGVDGLRTKNEFDEALEAYGIKL